MTSAKKRIDTQLIELAGRNWLASELQRAGIEVGRPEGDHGVDLIAYPDLDTRMKQFIACPIQMKASYGAVFSVYPRYAQFPDLLLVYVWNLRSVSNRKCLALNYREALQIAEKMGWTKTNSWRHGNGGRRGYSTTAPSKRLRRLLEPHEMSSEKWRDKICGKRR